MVRAAEPAYNPPCLPQLARPMRQRLASLLQGILIRRRLQFRGNADRAKWSGFEDRIPYGSLTLWRPARPAIVSHGIGAPPCFSNGQ
jgi:hypothetical protein